MSDPKQETVAADAILSALAALDDAARLRVLDGAIRRLGLDVILGERRFSRPPATPATTTSESVGPTEAFQITKPASDHTSE